MNKKKFCCQDSSFNKSPINFVNLRINQNTSDPHTIAFISQNVQLTQYSIYTKFKKYIAIGLRQLYKRFTRRLHLTHPVFLKRMYRTVISCLLRPKKSSKLGRKNCRLIKHKTAEQSTSLKLEDCLTAERKSLVQCRLRSWRFYFNTYFYGLYRRNSQPDAYWTICLVFKENTISSNYKAHTHLDKIQSDFLLNELLVLKVTFLFK